MARYLLVAYQTAQSPQLLGTTQELGPSDSSAEFVLLVPATRAGRLLIKEEGDPAEIEHPNAGSRGPGRGCRLLEARAPRPGPGRPSSDASLGHQGCC
jgi:hypothetical protein